MERFSKKRQAIIDCIKGTDVHPDAEWVYNKLKPEFPDLSLGTVYRNINELIEEGVIVCVGNVLDKERYDGNVCTHTHAICSKCGKILDVKNINLPDDLLKKAKKIEGFNADEFNIRIFGVCDDCKKN